MRQINSFAETMTVEFEEGKQVEYPFSQLDELELAYAITIHKSQGSEYPAVVLPILSVPTPTDSCFGSASLCRPRGTDRPLLHAPVYRAQAGSNIFAAACLNALLQALLFALE